MFIEFEGIKNARSLGGIPLKDGRRVRENVLIRCAHLADATDGDIALLQRMGLRYIVDFRDGLERERFPDRSVEGAAYHALQALPTFRDREKRDRAGSVPDFDATFARLYEDLAQGLEAREAYKEFFRLLLEAKGAPLLWHCTQGKDRTGVAALLLLTALGAERESMEEDYFLSNPGLEHMLREPMPEHMRAWPEEVRKKLILVRPPLLELFMEKTRERWGGLEGYLSRGLELNAGELEKLREYYTE